jgi:lycopene cyclase domain-containing protein
MTYSGFLAIFLLVPIVILAVIRWRRSPLTFQQLRATRKGKDTPLFQVAISSNPPTSRSRGLNRKIDLLVLGILSGVAVVYTAPWDNYLVANKIWWYDPERIAGIILGWVPLEEYVFFILQVFFTGLIALLFLDASEESGLSQADKPTSRWALPAILGILWLCAALILLLDWSPGIYLALLSLWALPPLAIQAAFGSDILWNYRRILATTISIPTFFLAISDALAINSGIWTINPERSLNLFLGPLPIEEFLFFLATNSLIASGVILAVSPEGRDRLKSFFTLKLTSKRVSSNPTKT